MPSVSAPALELPALACQTRPHHASGLDRSRALLKSYDCMITTFRHGQSMDYRTILVLVLIEWQGSVPSRLFIPCEFIEYRDRFRFAPSGKMQARQARFLLLR